MGTVLLRRGGTIKRSMNGFWCSRGKALSNLLMVVLLLCLKGTTSIFPPVKSTRFRGPTKTLLRYGSRCFIVSFGIEVKERMWLKFQVFHQRMSVQRQNEEWLLYRESETSIRARVYDVIIPSDLAEEELARYLADIYHEFASEKYPSVTRIL